MSFPCRSTGACRRVLATQLRRGMLGLIRSGALRPGVRLPSTRALAAQLGISRPLVLDTYAQLAAEGFLVLRPGARPVVTGGMAPPAPGDVAPAKPEPIRFDLRPAIPDLSMFPRQLWLRSLRNVLANLPASDLGYGDLRGSPVLRRALADYLGRVRGVIADPACIFITSGFAEARALACAALYAKGVRELAVEDPSYSDWIAVDKSGLRRMPVPVDQDGLDPSHLAALAAGAVFVTPAHQFPIGGVLSATRRRELVRWLRAAGRLCPRGRLRCGIPLRSGARRRLAGPCAGSRPLRGNRQQDPGTGAAARLAGGAAGAGGGDGR